jgi:tetratricopeptide (TPR) repeat protein
MPKRTTRAGSKDSSLRAKQLFSHALAMHRNGSLSQAQSGYEKVLKIVPLHFDSLHLLGVLCSQNKHYRRARKLIERAIAQSPLNANFHSSLGTVLQQLGLIGAALASFEQAIEIQPDFAQAHYNRGNCLSSDNRIEEAIASYDSAIALKPDFAQALFNRGNALSKVSRYGAAVASYDQVIALNAGSAEVHYNRGLALVNLGDWVRAVASFDQTIALETRHALAYFQLGNVLNQLGRTQDAFISYRAAVALDPSNAQAHANLGISLHELKQPGAAIISYDKAIALSPQHAQAHWNKSLAQLFGGDYQQGWKLYEWRWKVPEFITRPLVTQRPEWSGAQGKRVLLWAEQAIGEELMFSSFINEFSRQCAQLLVQVDPRLISLLTRSFPASVAIFFATGSVVSEDLYDEQIAMGGLCKFLRNQHDAFESSQRGYLQADADQSARIKTELLQGSNKKLCGVSWYCRSTVTGAARSIELKQLIAPLASAGYTFVNLQYGDTASEVVQLGRDLGVTMLNCPDVDNFMNIDGLAALIDACDVVVSVDNSTAHLSGALGKDVRVLLPFLADWRWQVEGSTSPWYSSMRLYRQEHKGVWSGPLVRVAADLKALVPEANSLPA